MISLLNSDARHIPLADRSVQCVVTSPPYWGLRDYGTATWEGGSKECDHINPNGTGNAPSKKSTLTTNNGAGPKPGDKFNSESERGQYRDTCLRCGARRIDSQIGLEPTPAAYVASIVAVMRECWRVMKDDGVLWLNLGDSYAGPKGNTAMTGGKSDQARGLEMYGTIGRDQKVPNGLKPKDLVGIPWRVAFALQDAGWYLRQDIIWHKPNPMPESVTDRCTKAHEYIFLLTKQARYYYDAEAIAEQLNGNTNPRPFGGAGNGKQNNDRRDYLYKGDSATRNRRSVWTVATQPYSGAKGLADYVGDDGKPYKASPDCPIHGHLARERTSYTVGYDARLNQNQSRNAGNGNGHEQAPASLQSATTYHTGQDERGENSQMQNPESIDGYRSEERRPESTSPAQTADRTNRTLEHDEPSDHTSDLKRREYSLSANGHSKRKSKTARARRTSQHDTASVQTHGHTQSMLPVDGYIDLDGRIDESNTSEGYASSEIDPSAEMSYRNAGIDSPFVTSHMSLYCTCEVVSTDHFATFPPALIEPMILAGTSQRGECPHCGKAWVRVVERTTSTPGQNVGYTAGTQMRNDGDRAGHFVDQTSSTLGWRQQCECPPHEPIPQTVLDPFAGSGTTGAVAVKHGRRAVLLDLSTKYIDLQFERTSGIQIAAPL